jgi:hypothetical protein
MNAFSATLCIFNQFSPVVVRDTMSKLNPDKLNVRFQDGSSRGGPVYPRKYTLTHSDTTGDLFLTIAPDNNHPQISVWYTRLVRDEVLSEWILDGDKPVLHGYCHVSGGLISGPAGYRDSIFKQHLPMVIESFFSGDRYLNESNPALGESEVIVHFHSSKDKYNRVEARGLLNDYRT